MIIKNTIEEDNPERVAGYRPLYFDFEIPLPWWVQAPTTISIISVGEDTYHDMEHYPILTKTKKPP